MVNPRETIQRVLRDNPAVDTVEEVERLCAAEGLKTGIFPIWRAAESLNHNLKRPQPPISDKPPDAALAAYDLVYWGAVPVGHEGALRVLKELEDLNKNGTFIVWRQESLGNFKYGLELSMAQQLVEFAGGFESARRAVQDIVINGLPN